MSVWRRISDHVIKSAFKSTIEINHDGINIKFCTPNKWARVRAETFSEKEPETLEWIDSFSPGTVLWDIGGNLGLYSLYTALKDNNAKVFTFEPSIFNLEIMTRNVVLNSVQEQITVMPVALSETSKIDTLHMTTTAWGGAMSTFGQNYGHDGKQMDQVFSYKMPSCSLDDLVEYFDIEQPNAIKMDVDGIEHLILKGGESILKSQQLKTILIEVNDDFAEQKNGVRELLGRSGFRLKDKTHASWMDASEVTASTFNQIWVREYESIEI